MFLFKRVVNWAAPIVGSQLFWLVEADRYWYYPWLLIWLIGGSLVGFFILGFKQKKHWAYVTGQYWVIMIMPALALTLISSLALQALLTVILALIGIGYYALIFERFLLKNEPTWSRFFLHWVLGFNMMVSLVGIYGFVEFLNFSPWFSALLAALFIGFFAYLEPSHQAFNPIAGIKERLLTHFGSTDSRKESAKQALIMGLLTLELFLAIWLLPIVFYLKALIVAWVLVFWLSRQYANNPLVYWWKWLLSGLLLIVILLLYRWF